jgi:hypothetical protein
MRGVALVDSVKLIGVPDAADYNAHMQCEVALLDGSIGLETPRYSPRQRQPCAWLSTVISAGLN